jgi:hypothetical protein
LTYFDDNLKLKGNVISVTENLNFLSIIWDLLREEPECLVFHHFSTRIGRSTPSHLNRSAGVSLERVIWAGKMPLCQVKKKLLLSRAPRKIERFHEQSARRAGSAPS